MVSLDFVLAPLVILVNFFLTYPHITGLPGCCLDNLLSFSGHVQNVLISEERRMPEIQLWHTHTWVNLMKILHSTPNYWSKKSCLKKMKHSTIRTCAVASFSWQLLHFIILHLCFLHFNLVFCEIYTNTFTSCVCSGKKWHHQFSTEINLLSAKRAVILLLCQVLNNVCQSVHMLLIPSVYFQSWRLVYFFYFCLWMLLMWLL